MFKIKKLKINREQVNFILESKALALGTNTTVPSQIANDSKKNPKAKANDSKKNPKAKANDSKKNPKANDSKKNPKAKALDSKKNPKAKALDFKISTLNSHLP
jgi:hypothetical protein